MRLRNFLLSLTLFLTLALSGYAETLVLYTFTGEVATPETTQPFVSATAITLSAGSVGFGTAQDTTWTGSGVPYAEGSGGWTAADQASAKHFIFTLSELNDATFTPTNISLRLRSTGAGPSAMGISINGVSVHSQNIPADSTFLISVPVSGFDDLVQAAIRIAGFQDPDRTTTGGGAFRIDDVLVEGTVEEPIGEFPPSVSAPVAPSRTATSLELGGTITATGGPDVTERGVYYSTVDGFTPPGQGTKVSETGTFDVGPFTLEVTGLDPNTEYFFRAFATNSEGTGFSDQASRSTLRAPPPDALAYYTFTDDQLAPEVTNIDVSATDFAVSAGTITFGTANAASWIALDAELPYVQSSSNWTTEDQETAKHYLVELMAEAGRAFTITNISFVHRRTAAGPQQTGVSIDGDSIFADELPENSTEFLSIPVAGYANLTSAVIRIEGWNASGTGSYQIDNVLIQGTVGGDVPPTVIDPTVTDIEGVSAVLGGTISDTGDSAVTERGVVWSITEDFDPETEGTVISETGVFATGAFTLFVTDFVPETNIYFRAFAANAAGAAYSEQAFFESETTRMVPYGTVWINEFNYNPAFFDFENTNEFIEIVAPVGLDVADWSLELWNADTVRYGLYVFPSNTVFSNPVNGFGFFVVGDADVPNVNQVFTHTAQDDALAKEGTLRILDALSNEIYAVSYGVPAPTGFPNAVYAGEDSDFVIEDESLALSGTGTNGLQFTWGNNVTISPGSANPGQTLEDSGIGPTPDILIVGLEQGATVTLQAEGIGSWNAVPQYTTNLVTSIWSDISPFTNQQAGGTNTITFSEPTQDLPVLYRIRATP